MKHVVVVGAGWAGLTAAIKLLKKGHRVTLIEAAKTVGGRARSITLSEQPLDNGQHILLGAYTETLAMLRSVGLSEKDCFQREALHLHMLDRQNGGCIRVQFKPYIAPWHAVAGLLSAKGLSLAERYRFIQICLFLRHAAQNKQKEDRAVLHFMQQKNQPQRLIDMVWSPLCLAALNTPIAEASLQLFAVVIREAFFSKAKASNFLFPKQGLSDCFPWAAIDCINKNKGTVCLGTRVTELEVDGDTIKGVKSGDELIVCDAVILAVAPESAQKLMPSNDSFSGNLGQMKSYPIITVYVQYIESVTLPQTMMGVANGFNQWVIDRRCCGQKGLMACVISGPQPKIKNKADLAECVVDELANLFPDWPEPLSTQVIQEKRATFVSRKGVDEYRPDCVTNIKGLYLAGDYTATGYPATIEGAVRSGLHVAKLV